MNKRSNAGRKPVDPAKKKKQVTLYLEQEVIDVFGSMYSLRNFIYTQILSSVNNAINEGENMAQQNEKIGS